MIKRCFQKFQEFLMGCFERLIPIEDEDEDEVVPEASIHDNDTIVTSPMRDSPVNSNVEETGGLDVSMKTSIVDTTINQGDYTQVSTLAETTVIPPEVSNAK
ncbi:unnamed protein product [Lactuca saligna]|uniref:Uncharacterized protein n=1 Tax=Lactuca saligna TaxID=75948 RepID=A0AA35UM19_LACSI|nr:unnamed protein product [Lactuca saligna]